VPNLYYSAPEVICLKKATFNSDLYSLGMMVYSIYKVMSTLAYSDAIMLSYDEFSENGHKNAAMTAIRNSNFLF
jgi:serine/threonine protein kinase